MPILASRRHPRALALAAAFTLLLAGPASAAAPKRIIALTPYSANTLALLGTKPIAIGQVPSGEKLFDSRLNGVKQLALSHPAGPNLEEVSKLDADFVFTTSEWSRGTTGMKRLGLRVADREPKSISDVPRQSARIGKLIGKAAIGKRLAAIQTAQIAAATKGITKHPKVMLVLGVGNTPYLFLANSWGGDLIRRAGATLITGGLRSSGGYAKISDEFVVAQNPDVIIAVPHGAPGDIPKIAKQLRDRPGWRTTKAARNKKLFISTSNTLLQPIVGAAATITSVRRSYLGN